MFTTEADGESQWYSIKYDRTGNLLRIGSKYEGEWPAEARDRVKDEMSYQKLKNSMSSNSSLMRLERYMLLKHVGAPSWVPKEELTHDGHISEL
jgi:hypothetical protein